MIKFHCPHCSQKLGVPYEYASRRVKCSKCSQLLTVPAPQATTSQQAVKPSVRQPVKEVTQSNNIKFRCPHCRSVNRIDKSGRLMKVYEKSPVKKNKTVSQKKEDRGKFEFIVTEVGNYPDSPKQEDKR